jgi:hypothetical protein
LPSVKPEARFRLHWWCHVTLLLGIKERQAVRWFAVFNDHIPGQGTTVPRLAGW